MIVLRLLKIAALLLVLSVVAGWLFLASPLFSGLRQDIVGGLLTSALQQPVRVEGNVRISPRRHARIHASGVVVESVTIPKSELATLGLLEFKLDVLALLDRRIDIDDFDVQDLQVSMLHDAQGRKSWTSPERVAAKTEPSTEQAVAAQGGHILELLGRKTVNVARASLRFENENSGFIFDFDLRSLTFEQLSEGRVLEVRSDGTVNGEPFSLVADIPQGADFESRFSFAGFTASLDGTPTPEGHRATLSVSSGQLSDLFKILRLDSSFDGVGRLETEIINTGDSLRVQNLSAAFDFINGHQVSVAGSVDRLILMEGLDIVMSARSHPENQPPPRARMLRDIRLVEIRAHVIGDKSDVEFEELLVRTNAINEEFDEIGPVSVGSIRRSPDSKLVVENVRAQAGPKDAPYLVVQGGLGDALNFKEVAFTGELSVPASVFLPEMTPSQAALFGTLKGAFRVEDTEAGVGLSAFDTQVVGSALWSMSSHAEIADLRQGSGLDLTFGLDISETADFLTALGLSRTGAGSLAVEAGVRDVSDGIESRLSLQTEASDLAAELLLSGSMRAPVVNGAVSSNVLEIADLRDAVKTLMRLQDLPQTAATTGKPVKPLVLPEESTRSEKPVKPLVIEAEEVTASDLFNPVQLLTDTDLHIGLDLRKITGPRGTSSLSSQLVAQQGKARLGPMDLRYGGGFFQLTADMDVINRPKEIALAGATGGWNFGDILKALEIDFPASGMLSGTFNLAGDLSSGKAFANSMRGEATLSMRDGQIATSLLELAGLGIFPWLFSQERRQGYTDVVCVAAPLVFRSGRAASQSVVAETRSVQLVARGEVDWRRDSIDLRVEPRRVGQPLSRSAWPFNVSGALSDPTFKLQIGGSRSRRADGADQMPADRKPCVPDIYQLQ